MHRSANIAFVIAIIGAGAFSYFNLFNARSRDAMPSDKHLLHADVNAEYPHAENNHALPMSSASLTTPQTIAADSPEKLSADVESDDPQRRAKAIATLAFKPKITALPVLQKVLSNGDDADRMRALDAIRALALQQGDADGAIRNVLRLTVYDGDDEGVANAQEILEEVEQGLVQMAPNPGS